MIGPVEGFGGHRLDRSGVADVEAGARGDALSRQRRQGVSVDVRGRDGGALARERDGAGPTYAGPRGGHERTFPLEPSCHPGDSAHLTGVSCRSSQRLAAFRAV